MFFAVYAYMAGFVGNFLVPKSIDSTPVESVGGAIAVDAALLLLFGIQHSVMAREGFKRAWTKLVPSAIERSTYVLVSNLAVMLLMWQWQSLPATVWNVEGAGRYVLWGLFATGWLLVPLASLMISHFDLFGLRQVWLHWRGQEYQSLPFHTPMLYRFVRHPLYVGWFTAFWMTPTMSAGHLLFAGILSAYMVAASRVEERDLVNHFGGLYEDYQQTVPAFVPRFGRRAVLASPETGGVNSSP
jgi:protein-S-isoprenylcysteine O-methyltransferase Ste14